MTFEKNIWPFTKYKATYINILKTTNSFHSEMANFKPLQRKGKQHWIKLQFWSRTIETSIYLYLCLDICLILVHMKHNNLFTYIKHEHCPNVWFMYLHGFCDLFDRVRPDLWSVAASVLKEEQQKVSLAPAYSGAHLCPFACGVCCSWVWRRGAVMTACHNTPREACAHRTPKSTPVSRAGNL